MLRSSKNPCVFGLRIKRHTIQDLDRESSATKAWKMAGSGTSEDFNGSPNWLRWRNGFTIETDCQAELWIVDKFRFQSTPTAQPQI